MAKARTAKQKAALRKAQLASARKRRGKGKGKLAAANRRPTKRRMGKKERIARTVAGVAVGAAYFHYMGGTENARELYRGIQHNRKIKRQRKIRDQWERHDNHLRRMKYGVSASTRATRVGPAIGRAPQRALPRGRR